MSKDERNYYHQNLLLLACIPFVVVGCFEMSHYEFELENQLSECKVVHHNLPHFDERKCDYEYNEIDLAVLNN